ncbi:MAG: hypothetical protein OEQ25_10370 [Gammaproteobacteria bacterium]|nr:hypothetical protein [Gammaproteobacteria bacterium]MDH3507531.1 hypothetical protein [Gammaproteobacteria bacterium]
MNTERYIGSHDDQPLRDRFILLAGLAFVGMTVLAGPIRMYLSQSGLSPLIYAPNALLMLAIAWQLIADPRENGFTALHLIALLVPCYALAIGLQFMPPVQVAMGFYVLLPFWFGLACGSVLLERWYLVGRFVPLCWLVVVAGVLANQFIEYPWEGFGYDLGNLDVEGSRLWYANGGTKRLAGFARASFDAAVHVQLAGVLLVLQIRGSLLRLLVWAVTIAAIVPTTSKGVLLAALVLTPIVLLRGALPVSPLRCLPAVVGSIGLALPVSTLFFTFSSPLKDPLLANLTNSFYDRLNDMWPEAWALLSDYGHVLLGRGVGGIGTAQSYFEPVLFNAGDNLFMYWFVVFGWAALPGFALLLLASLRIQPHRNAEEMRVYCLLLATLVYGMITNIVENALSALVFGMVVRLLLSKPAARRYGNDLRVNIRAVPIVVATGGNDVAKR